MKKESFFMIGQPLDLKAQIHFSNKRHRFVQIQGKYHVHYCCLNIKQRFHCNIIYIT